MSRLKWNSKQLMPKQFDSQSNYSNSSQKFEKYSRLSKDTSFAQEKQISIVKRLKRNNIYNENKEHSKSSTSIMCNVKRGRMKFLPNLLKTQENHQQTLQKQNKKDERVLAKAHAVLNQAKSLFIDIKQVFKQFQTYILRWHKQIQASFASLIAKDCYLNNVELIKNQTIYNTLKTLQTENTLSSTKNVKQQQSKHEVKIIATPHKNQSHMNSVRKTQSLLTYAEGHNDSNFNLLSPHKKISHQDKPIFQHLRQKITRRPNNAEKAPLITHSYLQNSSSKSIKSPRQFNKNQGSQKSVIFSSSLSQIQGLSRFKQSNYTNRQASPATKQLRQKMDIAIRTMKNVFINQ